MINLKKKKKQAFSLAEVMIALVIVAILMAASAPLVNRRASIDNNFSCYWKNATNGIYFNGQGTGQVGIGTEAKNQLQALHLFSEKTTSPQIAFYKTQDGEDVNVLGIYNDNIHIGTSGDINSTNNIVIGKVTDSNLLSDGDKLIIGGMNSNYPILYGKFNQNLSSQKLRVNGQLQIASSTPITLDDTNDASPYSLIAQNGILVKDSSGSISISSNGMELFDSSGNNRAKLTPSNISLFQGGSSTLTLNASDGSVTAQNITTNNLKAENGTVNIKNSAINIAIDSSHSISILSGDGKGCISIANVSIVIPNCSLSMDAGNISVSNGQITSTILELDGSGYLGPNLKSAITELVNKAAVSDIRLKNVIGNVPYGLEAIRKIEIKEYKFKDEKKYGQGVRYGVIAQEIQKILPKTVLKNKDGFLTIRTNDIFFVAINAIKELDKEVQTLKNRNKKLENEIQLLKKQNQNLEKKLSKIEKHLKLD